MVADVVEVDLGVVKDYYYIFVESFAEADSGMLEKVIVDFDMIFADFIWLLQLTFILILILGLELLALIWTLSLTIDPSKIQVFSPSRCVCA